MKTLLENPKVHEALKQRVRTVHKFIDFDKDIIEIAPNWAPMVTQKDISNVSGKGKVTYTDRITTEALLEREKTNPSRIEQNCEILPIDFVWDPGSELLKSSNNEKFDFAISSHVIEHIPDVLGHFIEIWNVLHSGGKYVFVLPNPLGTGEYFRRPSVLSDIVNSFFQDRNSTSPGQNWEYLTKAFHWTGASMTGKSLDDFKRHHTDAEAFQDAIRCQKEYVDVHCWCFSPENFAKTWHELTAFNLNPFDLVEIIESEEKSPDGHCGEFITILKRNDNFKLPNSWQIFVDENKKNTSVSLDRVTFLENEIQAIKNSTSWKITSPLRYIKKILAK